MKHFIMSWVEADIIFMLLFLLVGMGRPINACNDCSRCCTGTVSTNFSQCLMFLKVSVIMVVTSFFKKTVLQSPWGVAGGAITGHLFATTIAILGAAFLANYISENLV